MTEVVNEIANQTTGIYQEIASVLPHPFGVLLPVLVLVLGVFIYSLFVWHFYRFVAKKDLITLNLGDYGKSIENNFMSKIVLGFIYFIENILFSLVIIFIGYSAFTILFIFLNESLTTQNVILVSAVIVSVIRMTAYYKEALAKDLSKMLPFTLLAVSLLNPKFFDMSRIASSFSDIFNLFDIIILYFLFIIVLEVVLRLSEFVFSFFSLEEIEQREEEVKEE
ncbi:MAG: hypothetical protein ACOCUU_00195 [Nanoarchaeota archaeon]